MAIFSFGPRLSAVSIVITSIGPSMCWSVCHKVIPKPIKAIGVLGVIFACETERDESSSLRFVNCFYRMKISCCTR